MKAPSGPVTLTGCAVPGGSSHTESSRMNSSDPSLPQTGPSAPWPAAASGLAPEPPALATQSREVACHRRIQDGLKPA